MVITMNEEYYSFERYPLPSTKYLEHRVLLSCLREDLRLAWAEAGGSSTLPNPPRVRLWEGYTQNFAYLSFFLPQTTSLPAGFISKLQNYLPQSDLIALTKTKMFTKTSVEEGLQLDLVMSFSDYKRAVANAQPFGLAFLLEKRLKIALLSAGVPAKALKSVSAVLGTDGRVLVFAVFEGELPAKSLLFFEFEGFEVATLSVRNCLLNIVLSIPLEKVFETR